MLRIVTDTASDITPSEAERMGIDLVQLEIMFPDGPYSLDNDEDFFEFYRRLTGNKTLPTTSRPSPEAYLNIFLDAKGKQEEVVVLCLSSGLSSTIESAFIAKEMSEYDQIHVVDTHQAIIAQRMLVEYAVSLRKCGLNAFEIAQHVEAIRDDIVVCGVVDTLEFLKRGGRVPAGLAVIGEMLHIKPVIVLEDKILKTIGKARGRKAGISMLHSRMDKDGFDRDAPVYFGYTSNKQITQTFMLETMDKYKLTQMYLYPIGGIIGTHCGTDCIAVAYLKKNSAHRTEYIQWMQEGNNE